MKFMMTFSFNPATRDEVLDRYRRTGAVPPPGVKLLGRWIAADSSGGFDLLESDDSKALVDLSLMWSDLLEMSFIPVLEEDDFASVLKGTR
jgi:hypothetical protein